MREFLTRLGKVVYFGLDFKTANGMPPTDYQYYEVGLYLFIIGCASASILVIVGAVELIKHIKRRKQ